MRNKFKIGLAIILGAVAASLPIALSGSAAETFTPDNLPLTKISENNKTITFGWTPVPGYGYVFKTQASAGAEFVVVSRTNNADQSSVRFSKGSYDYAVGALGEVAVGKASDIAAPPPPPPPPTVPIPANFRVTDKTQTSVDLAWDAVTNATNYRIYRNNNLIGQGPGSNGGFSDSWADTGLTCGTTYNYAVDAQINSDTSEKATLTVATNACAAPDSQAPTAPTGVAASSVSQTSAVLSWNPSTDNVGVDHYNMVRSGTVVSQVSASPFTFSGLTCNTNYALGVQAEDAAGNKSTVVGVNVTTAACSNPPPPGGTITGSECSTRAAVNGAVIDNVTVTGNCSVRGDNVTISNSTIQGGVTFTASSNGSSLRNSSAYEFDLESADNTTIEGNTLDGHNQSGREQNFIWADPAPDPVDGFVIRNNYFTNFTSPGSTHSEAMFIGGYTRNGLIEGNDFYRNGNTAHIFFSWCAPNACDGTGNNPDARDPKNMCVRNNTFRETWDAYYQVVVRQETNAPNGHGIYTDDNIKIAPGQSFANKATNSGILVQFQPGDNLWASGTC